MPTCHDTPYWYVWFVAQTQICKKGVMCTSLHLTLEFSDINSWDPIRSHFFSSLSKSWKGNNRKEGDEKNVCSLFSLCPFNVVSRPRLHTQQYLHTYNIGSGSYIWFFLHIGSYIWSEYIASFFHQVQILTQHSHIYSAMILYFSLLWWMSFSDLGTVGRYKLLSPR